MYATLPGSLTAGSSSRDVLPEPLNVKQYHHDNCRPAFSYTARDPSLHRIRLVGEYLGSWEFFSVISVSCAVVCTTSPTLCKFIKDCFSSARDSQRGRRLYFACICHGMLAAIVRHVHTCLRGEITTDKLSCISNVLTRLRDTARRGTGGAVTDFHDLKMPRNGPGMVPVHRMRTLLVNLLLSRT